MTTVTESHQAVWQRVQARWSEVRASTDAQLSAFCRDAATSLVSLDMQLDPLAAAVTELALLPGKRIRPLFVHYGQLIAGGGDPSVVARCAAGVEMLHVMALLHDDVIDESVLRRGAPSAHVRFAQLYRAQHGSTGAGAHGRASAILAGDLALTWSDELFDSTDVSPEVWRRMRALVRLLRAETIAGEYLDLPSPAPTRPTQAFGGRALLKSGRYTVTRPLQLGASLGAHPTDDGALSSFGDAVGLSFQLRDDLLDGDAVLDCALMASLLAQALDKAHAALDRLDVSARLREELHALAHYASSRVA